MRNLGAHCDHVILPGESLLRESSRCGTDMASLSGSEDVVVLAFIVVASLEASLPPRLVIDVVTWGALCGGKRGRRLRHSPRL